MITDADITKLKRVFLTKEEALNLATKNDLKAYATKEDLADLRVEVGELKERVDIMDTKLDAIMVTMDAVVGGINDFREDNAAGSVMLCRHERHITHIARETGVTLPE